MTAGGDFYRAFEDRHRGTRERVQERQRVYLPYLRAAANAGVPRALVDLGCGRGEWLELACAEGWQARGVDQDEGMLEASRTRGLQVDRGDLLAYLAGCESGSLGAITALQVAEHLPFDALQQMIREAARVLAPGGLMVLETPNPENLVVGSSAFYMDPTHAKPLPPLLLSFLAGSCGFSRVSTLRLNEGLAGDAPVSLIDVLAGVSPDYAIVARKPGGNDSPELDELMARQVGFTLNQMAERYDARLRELERRTIVAEGVKEAAVAELFHARQAWRNAEDLVAAMHASTSWRVTVPLRRFGAYVSESRRRGLRAFARSILQRLRALLRPPLENHAAASPPPAPPSPPPAPAPIVEAPPPPPAPMTAAARRLYEEMLEADGSARRKEA
jgi:O-antigen chain-terminating methyltransferase